MAHKPVAQGGRARAQWVRVHRWLGLALLLLWLMLGLTGSLLVFYRELDAALNRPLMPPAPASAHEAGFAPASLDAVLQALRSAHPQRMGPWRIELPEFLGDPIVARYPKPAEMAEHGFAPLMVWVDPRTMQVTRSSFWGDDAMTWLYNLHYTLLFDLSGREVLGWLGCLMLVSLVSGLVLWWPKAGQWRAALRFKRGASGVRQVYDVHKLTGVYASALLLMLTVTGVCLAWPARVQGWLKPVSPLYAMPVMPASGAPQVSLALAVQVAQMRFPSATLRWVESSPVQGGVIRVNVWQEGEPSHRLPRSNVWVDAHSGRIVAVRDALAHGAGDVFLSWLHPLHNGEIIGMPGRVLVAAAGLAPCVLAFTGWLRWRHKRRGERAAAHLRAQRLTPR